MATWWSLRIDGDATDEDLERIAQMVKGGFKEGPLVEQEETCEDRGYECCELFPPVSGQSWGEYVTWYNDHLTAYCKGLNPAREATGT